MEHKLVFSLILLTLLSVSLASANLGTYKQHECVNVVTILNGTSSVNLTIYYPNNSLAENSLMTKNGNRYTREFCTTGLLGTYNYDYFDDTGGSYVNAFDVTPSGDTSLLGLYFLIIILSYGVMVLGIYKQDIPITILGTFGLYFVGLYILFYGLDIYKNWMTQAFAIITLGIAGYVSVRCAYETIVD